jgi:hypothetical protein
LQPSSTRLLISLLSDANWTYSAQVRKAEEFYHLAEQAKRIDPGSLTENGTDGRAGHLSKEGSSQDEHQIQSSTGR